MNEGQRDKEIDRWRSVQTLLHFMKAARNRSETQRGKEANEIVMEIRDKVRELRKEMRPVASARTFVEIVKAGAESKINNAVYTLMMADHRRTRFDVKVGGRGSGNASRFGGRIDFHLGWRWHGTIYPLAKAMLTRNILPLTAIEYKVNVREVRIFASKVWDFKKKEAVNGYIGLSTYSNKSVFKLTAAEAIRAAQASTVRSIDAKLKGKENG